MVAKPVIVDNHRHDKHTHSHEYKHYDDHGYKHHGDDGHKHHGDGHEHRYKHHHGGHEVFQGKRQAEVESVVLSVLRANFYNVSFFL